MSAQKWGVRKLSPAQPLTRNHVASAKKSLRSLSLLPLGRGRAFNSEGCGGDPVRKRMKQVNSKCPINVRHVLLTFHANTARLLPQRSCRHEKHRQ